LIETRGNQNSHGKVQGWQSNNPKREHDRYCTRNDERIETKRLNLKVVLCRISNI